MDRVSEFALIADLFAPLAREAGAFGLADDVAAVAARPGHDTVLNADAIVEGVHFLPADPPETVAQKALRVNLSDLAAKGAEPFGYLLTLALPERTGMEWLSGFAHGLGEDQSRFGISLLGGDTVASPALMLSVTMIGHVPEGTLIRRRGARPGDLVFVTGTLGDAAAGLAILKGADTDAALVSRYRMPEPRLAFGRSLRGIATAALDVSDGLMADLGHMADASGVRIAVEAAALPLSDAVRALWGGAAAVRAATSGDDYEIVFAAPPQAERRIAALAVEHGLPVARIGRVEAGAGVTLLDAKAQEITLTQRGYTHF